MNGLGECELSLGTGIEHERKPSGESPVRKLFFHGVERRVVNPLRS